MADAVLEKDAPYLEFKEKVDSLLVRRYSLGFFVSKMNEVLGDHAAIAPHAVSKALKAIRFQNPDILKRYLVRKIRDEVTIDRLLNVVGIAITVLNQ